MVSFLLGPDGLAVLCGGGEGGCGLGAICLLLVSYFVPGNRFIDFFRPVENVKAAGPKRRLIFFGTLLFSARKHIAQLISSRLSSKLFFQIFWTVLIIKLSFGLVYPFGC